MTKSVMEIVRRIAVVIAVVLGIAWTGLAETVENVRGSQRENSKLVDIYYNLNDTDGGTYYVAVEVVGRTSEVTASSFSGDVGEGVVPGQNRHVVWDAGADWPGNKGDVKAVVTAIKGGKPNKVQLWEGGPYWADRNIGADNPWDYGLYFWWGDTTGHCPSLDGKFAHFMFTESNCPTYRKEIDELQSDGWIGWTVGSGQGSYAVLAQKHDAAHVKWGGSWRMPTYNELIDLNSKCDWTWATMNDIGGYIVRGRGDYASNCIFLPCAGAACENGVVSRSWKGYYWSSVPYSDYDYAYGLDFYSGYHYTYDDSRYYGRSVRPVQGFTE